MKEKPKWIVIYLIINRGNSFVGKAAEFFIEKEDAQKCYERQLTNGNIPTIRKFETGDVTLMNQIDAMECGLFWHKKREKTRIY